MLYVYYIIIDQNLSFHSEVSWLHLCQNQLYQELLDAADKATSLTHKHCA